MSLDAKLARESRFWDAKAAQDAAEDPELYRVEAGDRHDRSIPWGAQLGFPAFVQTVLDRLGDVRDRRVLDLGTGTGFLASLLAAEGARVERVDVSAASRRRRGGARRSAGGGPDRLPSRPGRERCPFPDGSFDAVCGAFVLHHLDLPVAGPELEARPRAGRRGAFIETSANNVLLMAARRLLPAASASRRRAATTRRPSGGRRATSWRAPSGRASASIIRNWCFFRMASYVPPLQPAARRSACLRGIDAALHRSRRCARNSYHCVVSFTTASELARGQAPRHARDRPASFSRTASGPSSPGRCRGAATASGVPGGAGAEIAGAAETPVAKPSSAATAGLARPDRQGRAERIGDVADRPAGLSRRAAPGSPPARAAPRRPEPAQLDASRCGRRSRPAASRRGRAPCPRSSCACRRARRNPPRSGRPARPPPGPTPRRRRRGRTRPPARRRAPSRRAAAAGRSVSSGSGSRRRDSRAITWSRAYHHSGAVPSIRPGAT